MCGVEVFTPLGRGRVVYTLPSGRVLVEFPYGDGQLFFKEEIRPIRSTLAWPGQEPRLQRMAS